MGIINIIILEEEISLAVNSPQIATSYFMLPSPSLELGIYRTMLAFTGVQSEAQSIIVLPDDFLELLLPL